MELKEQLKEGGGSQINDSVQRAAACEREDKPLRC